MGAGQAAARRDQPAGAGGAPVRIVALEDTDQGLFGKV
jgi:hypothetical protein